jgi:competence protein ComEA
LALTRIGLIVLAIVAAVASVFALFRSIDEREAPPIIIEDTAATVPIVVDVRGAVSKPGVYELAPGARMQDALTAAGGLAPAADLSTINLARRLRDSEVIMIAEIATSNSTPRSASVAVDASGVVGNTSKVNVNSASVTELVALPGIGDVTAKRIIDYREANGPFRSIDDLTQVHGISAHTVDGLRDLVTTGP